jgi:hypothetical protein
MVGRVVRDAATATAALVAATLLMPIGVGAANTPPLPVFSLAAVLTVAPDLPVMSRRVLVSEAERIWRREGIALQWPTSTTSDTAAALRVLVIDRREALLRPDRDRWRVGELLPQTNRRALAIASIAGAERVLAEATDRRLALLEPRQLAEYRLGVVLGRAVAHEIGHYLLATPTHATHGLMRAAIEAREFADPAAKTFALDDTAGIWLRHRLHDQHPADTPLPASGFTYTRPTDASAN